MGHRAGYLAWVLISARSSFHHASRTSTTRSWYRHTEPQYRTLHSVCVGGTGHCIARVKAVPQATQRVRRQYRTLSRECVGR
eukprot:957881-Rhodomonas_salina.2